LYSSAENHAALWEILGDNRHGSEKSGSQSGVAQRDDFLMHGAIAARQVAAFHNCFLVSVNSLFPDLSCRDL
jgi:hypothetical protein